MPWNIADIFDCADLAPTVGITGTPVVDPATNTEYLFKKTYTSGTSGPAAYCDAHDRRRDRRRAFGLSGSDQRHRRQRAVGDVRSQPTELQRPGLFLMNGVVYAAFGGLCDRDNFRGWIIGVSTTGQIKARWAAQQSVFPGSGIWQSGGPLISDVPGDIITGHRERSPPARRCDARQPRHRAISSEAVVRVTVQPNGTLKAVDFFTPYDAPELDVHDVDFGSGGPVALPDSFGTPSHPHLMLAIGKAGYVYLLDRDHLGGYRNDGQLADDVVARLGPYGGVWSTPAVWPGDGGYVYITHGRPVRRPLRPPPRVQTRRRRRTASRRSAFVGSSDDIFGFGSGTAVVTSDGLTPGSALVWVIWQADGTGADAPAARLRRGPGEREDASAVERADRDCHEVRAARGRRQPVYVGTRNGGDGNGRIIGFGSPVDQPLTATPGQLSFPATTMGQTATKTFTFTATRAVTVNKLTSSVPAVFTIDPPLSAPTVVNVGSPLTVTVKFTPNVKGLTSGTLTADVTSGTDPDVGVGLRASAALATGDLDVFPTDMSLGGAPLGGSTLISIVTFTNLGAQATAGRRTRVAGCGVALRRVGCAADRIDDRTRADPGPRPSRSRRRPTACSPASCGSRTEPRSRQASTTSTVRLSASGRAPRISSLRRPRRTSGRCASGRRRPPRSSCETRPDGDDDHKVETARDR